MATDTKKPAGFKRYKILVILTSIFVIHPEKGANFTKPQNLD